MVRVKGPLLSQAASGKLGQAVIFTNRKGQAYVKKHTKPKNPKSGLQVSSRAMLYFLSKQWSNLTAPQQATWSDAYPDSQLPNYNAFIKHNLERWRTKRPPSKQFPATEENALGITIQLNATGGARHIELDAYLDMVALDNWTALLFHSTIATPDMDVDKLIHVFLLEDMDHNYWTHSPLLPGTHYYQIVNTTDDGYIDWTHVAIASAVVT